jgi:hypothetical protein
MTSGYKSTGKQYRNENFRANALHNLSATSQLEYFGHNILIINIFFSNCFEKKELLIDQSKEKPVLCNVTTMNVFR